MRGTLGKVIADSQLRQGFYGGVLDKFSDPGLDLNARELIRKLIGERELNIEIIKKTPTHAVGQTG